MATLSDALSSLDSLIAAKITGASDLSEFYDRKLDALGINAATSLQKLLAIREQLRKAVSANEGGEYVETLIV